MKNIVFFDTETTGLDPAANRIIELAAIRYEVREGEFIRMEDMDDFISLPDGETLPGKIVELTGITDKKLREEGQKEEIVAKKFLAMIDRPDTALVAHNAQFDLAFASYMIVRASVENIGLLSSIDMIDTLTIAKDRKTYPHKLCDMIDYYGLDAQNSHRALDDVDALSKLFFAMKKERDDLQMYINTFGVNPRYGLNGPKFRNIRYFKQPYRKNEGEMVTADRILPLVGEVII